MERRNGEGLRGKAVKKRMACRKREWHSDEHCCLTGRVVALVQLLGFFLWSWHFFSLFLYQLSFHIPKQFYMMYW